MISLPNPTNKMELKLTQHQYNALLAIHIQQTIDEECVQEMIESTKSEDSSQTVH